MVLDIQMFRKDQGGNPDLLRESQRRRHKDVGLVDNVINLDLEWRAQLAKAKSMRELGNAVSKAVGEKKKKKEPEGDDIPVPEELRAKLRELTPAEVVAANLNTKQLQALSKEVKEAAVQEKEQEDKKLKERNDAVKLVGNIVHETCIAESNEDHNEIVRKWPEDGKVAEKADDTWNHVDLMELIGGMDTSASATATAGGRAYFLKGDLVRLQLALINYAMSFLANKSYTPLYPPFFMTKDMMANVAELAQFDEELYHVSGEGEDKYLIATSEQPLCAMHAGKWFQEQELKEDEPVKYAGYSTCFRKEAGSHGRDTLGIFRVHQFEKIEQFIVCQPDNGESWKMLEDMITTSEEFYKSLGLPYRVVSIVAGAMNLAAAKKYDLEAWFPASQKYRELVSCSNCTDYQARAINCRFGASTKGTAKEDEMKKFVHMLNGTLCAITRTMCCIVENHQTAEGIVVPEPLRMFMGGIDLIKFAGPKVRPVKEEKPKKK